MVNSYAHDMPFGAQVAGDGQTRFQLWAPDHQQVTLVLEGRNLLVPMTPADDGFFTVTTAARPGDRYRFQFADGSRVPDPASRYQPQDVHGPSEIVDPRAFQWQHPEWKGRPWHETVLYELHVGAFTEQGTFDALRRKLDYLAALGVTAIELMPVADFSGSRNWGYDGVLLFAPDSAYGTPADLKRVVDEAHARDLMVFLDAVYNHLGPDGNYLHQYAESYFDESERTPWGPAINYAARPVRDFAIHNALYWLNEYRFDGLRLDAVDRIVDRGNPHILAELATTIRRTTPVDRHVHLMLENDRNDAGWLERTRDGRPVFYDAQWNDDIHHVYHHLATGETSGYYRDYEHGTLRLLARALTTGFAYQGEPSNHRNGALRGTRSGHLPPTAFVSFVQNHDQIGNRAFGERITRLAPPEAVQALQAVVMLAPTIPLLFMGEEWGSTQPFCFFVDFRGDLARGVREGRRQEALARSPMSAAAQEQIPDPNALSTFLESRLDWAALEAPAHATWLDFVRTLLRLRREVVVPRLPDFADAQASALGDTGLQVIWRFRDGAELCLIANLAPHATAAGTEYLLESRVLLSLPESAPVELHRGHLPPWSVLWLWRGPRTSAGEDR